MLALLTLGGGGTSILLGYNLTSEAVVGEAQRRAELDLVSAWAQYRHQLDRVALVVRLVSQIQKTHDLLTGASIDRDWARRRLEDFRQQYGLDTLTIVGADGKVVMRSRYPYLAGDGFYADPVCRRAMRGQSASGTVRVPSEVLGLEGEFLREQVFMEVKETAMAAPSDKAVETDGMMLKAAEPVFDSSNRLVGFVYGGVLLNRNYAVPDGMRDTIFKSESYKGKPLGTVTIFQDDLRIATNVLNHNGTRAIGTRVSSVVRDQVLDNARPYYDRAFVVNDWYLTAYDPIRDPDGKVIGILYVGILEQKYLDYKTQLTQSFVGLTGIGVLMALVVALIFAVWVSTPIKRLTAAAAEMSDGNFDARVTERREIFKEIKRLNHAFNNMADAVVQRGAALTRANTNLERSNAELTQLNQNYMDMLGFVTHELKSPVASMQFSLGAITAGYFGAITQQQASVLGTIEKSVEYLDEMILNYLNLSLIERGELRFSPERFSFKREVVEPILTQIRGQLEVAQMTLLCEIPEEVSVEGDANLLKIVVDNLLSNAIKYGKPNTAIQVRYGPAVRGGHRVCVHNDGQGISPSDIDKLFKKFSRLAVSELRAKKGTGLGLFITQAIIAQHGGRIWAESKLGEWVDFVFELPANVPREPLRPHAASNSAGRSSFQ